MRVVKCIAAAGFVSSHHGLLPLESRARQIYSTLATLSIKKPAPVRAFGSWLANLYGARLFNGSHWDRHVSRTNLQGDARPIIMALIKLCQLMVPLVGISLVRNPLALKNTSSKLTNK